MTKQANIVTTESDSEIAIGIDIGTWPCCVAVWNGSQVDIFNNTTKEKKIMKSSYETFKDADTSIGVITQLSISLSQDQQHDMFYEATVYNMKRLIGRIDTDQEVHASKDFPFMVQTLSNGIRPFFAELMKDKVWRYTTAERFLAIYLGQLKVLAETQLKRPIRSVVFTVPVSFSRLQLTRIHRACAMAGLHVLKLMPQPTAVALMYAHQQMQASSSSHENIDSESNKIALIFNMDSGYCDVAVSAATTGGECQIKALAGCAVGGEDLLENMICYLLPDSENIFKKLIDGDKEIKSMSLLRLAALEAIRRLSSQTSVEFDLDLGDGLKICKVVKREEFEEVNKEVFEKCERLIIQCLQDAEVKVEDIDDVIIVGGCWNIPRVKNLVTKICKGKELYKGMNPLEAALCGAAVAGAVAIGIDDPSLNLNLSISQVAPLALGIQAKGKKFVPVIPRNASVPTTGDIHFTTIHDNQSEALIRVYEGEGQKTEENHFLGYLKIMGIPAAPKGVPDINLCMDISGEKRLKVRASVVMPGSHQPVMLLVIEARMAMPMIVDGNGWCVETLNRTCADTMDLVTLLKKE